MTPLMCRNQGRRSELQGQDVFRRTLVDQGLLKLSPDGALVYSGELREGWSQLQAAGVGQGLNMWCVWRGSWLLVPCCACPAPCLMPCLLP